MPPRSLRGEERFEASFVEPCETRQCVVRLTHAGSKSPLTEEGFTCTRSQTVRAAAQGSAQRRINNDKAIREDMVSHIGYRAFDQVRGSNLISTTCDPIWALWNGTLLDTVQANPDSDASDGYFDITLIDPRGSGASDAPLRLYDVATYLKHKVPPHQHVPGPASGKEYWQQQDRHLVAYYKGKRASEQVVYFRIERRYIQKTVRITRGVPPPVALPEYLFQTCEFDPEDWYDNLLWFNSATGGPIKYRYEEILGLIERRKAELSMGESKPAGGETHLDDDDGDLATRLEGLRLANRR